jgi:hypothetical protein
MKTHSFILVFLGVVVLAGTIVMFRDKIFVNEPYIEPVRTAPPNIHYFKDQRTSICFAELQTQSHLYIFNHSHTTSGQGYGEIDHDIFTAHASRKLP